MSAKAHWDRLYAAKPPDALSWHQTHAERSLRLIQATEVPLSAPIIDVGGGASTLVDDLLDFGYTDLTVLDVSVRALAIAQSRLGPRAGMVRWIAADIAEAALPDAAYVVWHDRAVFHFLTTAAERGAYVAAASRAVRPGGHLIIATFAEDGPSQCSGLPVICYSAPALEAEFGPNFTLVGSDYEAHRTPAGVVQRFIYCRLCKRPKGENGAGRLRP